ncbi:MAG: quinone-dependent dihydroorotate dehydrogenase [Methylococcales bacterium]
MNLYPLLRPLFFQLNPETAHNLTLVALRTANQFGLIPEYKHCKTARKITIMGLNFPNPLGLAAGLDKNGDCIEPLAALGFGFIEIGTVTPRPQPGNPKPRLFRLPQAEAIINRMGFNNKGVDYLVNKVKQSGYQGILGINIGKNFDTPIENAVDDYLIGLRKVSPYASYVTINISSPNTANLRKLQQADEILALLSTLSHERDRLAIKYEKPIPLVVKIAPDLTPKDIRHIGEVIVETNIDGVIATNTTLARQGVEGLTYSEEAGGLSGGPLTERSTLVITELDKVLKGKIPIIAAGGIMSARDAQAKLNAGAKLIQIYSGLIYRGPGLIKSILENQDF